MIWASGGLDGDVCVDEYPGYRAGIGMATEVHDNNGFLGKGFCKVRMVMDLKSMGGIWEDCLF